MSDVAEGIVQAQGWLAKVWACSRSAVECEETGMHFLQLFLIVDAFPRVVQVCRLGAAPHLSLGSG